MRKLFFLTLRFLALGGALVLPSMVLADGGHGVFSQQPENILHYVLNPEHSVQLLSVAVIVIMILAIAYKAIAYKKYRQELVTVINKKN